MRLTAVLAVIAACIGCRSADGDRPGTVISPDMAFTIPYDPFDPNPVNANGATLLQPPAGTVHTRASSFPYDAGREEAARAGLELKNPIPADAKNLKRGQHIFQTYCVVCHGKEGKGDGPIIGRFPNPPSLLAERARSMPDGEIFHIITRGQGIMAAYNLQVLPPDRWRAINYLRQLQGAK